MRYHKTCMVKQKMHQFEKYSSFSTKKYHYFHHRYRNAFASFCIFPFKFSKTFLGVIFMFKSVLSFNTKISKILSCTWHIEVKLSENIWTVIVSPRFFRFWTFKCPLGHMKVYWLNTYKSCVPTRAFLFTYINSSNQYQRIIELRWWFQTEFR